MTRPKADVWAALIAHACTYTKHTLSSQRMLSQPLSLSLSLSLSTPTSLCTLRTLTHTQHTLSSRRMLSLNLSLSLDLSPPR